MFGVHLDKLALISRHQRLQKMSEQKGADFNVVVVAEQEPLFHRRILEAARQFGDDDIALTDCETGESLTFGELRCKSIQLAAALHTQLGLGPHGGPLLCLWPNCVQYPLVLLAGALIGAPCSGAPADSSIEDLTLFLAKTGCQAVFATDACPHLDWLAQEVASRGIPLILLWDNDGKMDEKMDGKSPLTMGLDFHRLLEEGARLVDTEEQIQEWLATGPDLNLSPDHPFAAPLSSGASGVPKVVLQTHRNYIGATQILKNAVFDELTTKGGGRRTTIAAQPFCHASGLWILCYCLQTGHRSLVMRKFQPFLYLELIKEYKIDTLSLGPWLISLLLKQNLGAYDLSSVRTIISGGSSEATNALQNAQFLEHFPAVENFLIGYGMTEIVLISHLTPLGMDPGDERRLHSVGKLLPGFEHKIIECVSGNDLTNNHQPNVRGELWLRSVCVMAGYLNDPVLTELAIDGEGWFHTGDVVYTDADGFFFVVDRLSNMILVDGHQVWPAELESVILRHPEVLEACVLGVSKQDNETSKPTAEEVPMALVILKKLAENNGEECQREQSTLLLLLEEIRDFANARLNEHQQIRAGISAVESLPKTPFGKVARQKVKAMVKRMEEEGKGFWVGRDEEKLGKDEEEMPGKDEKEAGKDEELAGGNEEKISGRDEDEREGKKAKDVLEVKGKDQQKEAKKEENERKYDEDDDEEGEEMAERWMLEEVAKSKEKKSEENTDDDSMKHLRPILRWDEEKPEEKKEDEELDSIEAEIGTSVTTINKKVSFDLDGKKEVNFAEEALIYEAKPADEEEWEVKKEIIKINLDGCMEEIKKKEDDDEEEKKKNNEEKEEEIDWKDEVKFKKLMKKPKTPEEEKNKNEEKKEEKDERNEEVKKEETKEDEARKEEKSMVGGKMKPAAEEEEEEETITICHPEEFDDDEHWQKALLEEAMSRALTEAAEIGTNANTKKEGNEETVEKEVEEEEDNDDGETILL